MRLHGMSRDAFDRFTAKVPSWYYEIVAPGFKYNLTDIAAALGIQQLKRASAFQRRREAIAARLRRGASPACRWCCRRSAGAGDLHSWHLYVVRLADEAPIARDRFIERLFAAGIGCSVHYIPLHLHPYWRDRYGLAPATVPAQPARLRAHAEPAAVHAHERRRRAARGRCRRGAAARLSAMAKRAVRPAARRPRAVLLAPLLARDRARDQARLAGAGVLPPGARRPRRACRSASTSSAR